MAKKMGRPTDSPKKWTIKMRADEETVKKLEEASGLLNVSKSEVIRLGIIKIYDVVKQK